MHCNDASMYLHNLLDDALDEPLRQRVEEHIANCAACRQHYTELGLVVQRLSHADWHKAPANFTENLMARMERDQLTRNNWRVPIVRWTGIAAAAAFVFALGVWWSAPGKLTVESGQVNQLIIDGKQVIVPEGYDHKGDLVVQNGNILVKGKVEGNITAINGQIYEQAGADISGHVQEINESLHIITYYVRQFWTMVMNALQ